MIKSMMEVYAYRSMLWSMILSDLRTRYKGSVLGFLWTFMNPLLMLLVYMLVFSTVMRIRIPNYAVYLFIGLLAWNVFANSLQSASSVIVRQASMVKKIYFPRAILPLAVVGGSVMNYLFSLAILIPLLLMFGYYPSLSWLLLVVILFIETLFTAGVALLVSSVNVYFRDVEHVLSIFMMMWFYITPVVYPITMVPHRMGQLFKLNPMTALIYSFQSIFYYEQPIHWKLFVYAIVVSCLVFVIGWQVFQRLSRRFAEEV